MARKPIVRSLPSLRSLFPRFRGFTPRDNQSGQLLEKLRAASERVRQRQAVPFYSMREVAGFFGVSLRVVVRAYEKLEHEGRLTRMRGSQTLVEGRQRQARYPVLGVVGLPVELPGFVYGTDWRTFYITLEEELRRHDHLVNFIFLRRLERADLDLGRRLLEHKPDIVFWWVPTPLVLPAMHQVRDAGVRIVGVTRERETFPFPMYRHNRERSLRQAFEAWRQDGIESFVILSPTHEGAAYEVNLAASILRDLKAEFSLLALPDAKIPPQIHRFIRRKNVGIILSYHAWYDALCSRFPEAMERFFRNCRVLLVQGAVHHPSFQGRNIPADVLTMDCREMARRIARNLGTGRVWQEDQLPTFYGRWSPRLDLGQVSRET